jgi:predicted RNase H-like HicB family nuclease
MMKTMPEPQQLHVSVHQEDGAFWATVEEYPGVLATGDDLDELRESLQEGISLVLALPGEEPPAVSLSGLRLEPVAIAAGAELVYA